MTSSTPPPPGGDYDIGYRLDAVALSTFLAAAIAVTLRLYARLRYARVGWDDGLMLLALGLALLATVMELIAIDRGLGRHFFYLDAWQREQQSMYNTISQAFCILSLCFCKISICLSLLRIIQSTRQNLTRWVLYTIMVLVLIINVIVVITLFEQCRPTAKVWNRPLPGVCWKFPKILYVAIMQGAFSAFTDFLLSALPVLIFQHLHMDRKSRIVLCILMGLGVFTGVIAIVRAVQTGLSIHGPGGGDTSYGAVLPLIWASLERNVAIMAASIPPSRPLLQPFLRLTGSGSSRYRGKASYPQSQEHFNLSKLSNVSKSHEIPGKRHASEDGGLPVYQDV